MGNTVTDHDMRDQVATSLTEYVGEFNVQGIVDEIQAAYGTVPIDQVPHATYWAIVERHDTVATRGDEPDTGAHLRNDEGRGLTAGAVRTVGTRGRALGPDDPHSAAFRG